MELASTKTSSSFVRPNSIWLARPLGNGWRGPRLIWAFDWIPCAPDWKISSFRRFSPGSRSQPPAPRVRSSISRSGKRPSCPFGNTSCPFTHIGTEHGHRVHDQRRTRLRRVDWIGSSFVSSIKIFAIFTIPSWIEILSPREPVKLI